MQKIFIILGKSSSGKDTIYKRLTSGDLHNLKTITTYTTRPIREGEQDGKEYYFVTTTQLEQYKAQGKVIEYRDYNTAHGIWTYFTVDDGQINLSRNSYIIIGTLESLLSLKAYFGNEQIIPIYIEVDPGIRLQRALDRERAQLMPKYEEMCRRFLADEKDFSEEQLSNAKIEKKYINNNLEQCISEINQLITLF